MSDGFPLVYQMTQEQADKTPPVLLTMDPPEHKVARRAVSGEFTVRRMQKMRPRIQEIVDDRVDEMVAAGSPADLVGTLALLVPSLVICELLGVPHSDHDYFQSRTVRVITWNTSNEEKHQALNELWAYMHSLVSRKEERPTDDLLGMQIVKDRAKDRHDHDALVGLGMILLMAGHETTANMISLGTLALLENPDQLGEIITDPTKTPAAVEEILRYVTIAELVTLRAARSDVQVGDTLIRAGEGIVALGSTANRDPETFARPDRLDVDRSARSHLAFGFGPHQCLGQNLARIELEVVFETLFRRLPGLRLAVPADELRFKDDATLYSLHELPVAW